MTSENTNSNIKNSYLKNNRIRTKLLLFIDNEILSSKMNRNNEKIKCRYNDDIQFKINFEETFCQKQAFKYDFSSSNIIKTKKSDKIDKSFLGIDNSTNKIITKLNKKERRSTHLKILAKEGDRLNKILNNTVYLNNKKTYSGKNLPRRSSTFLLLSKQKNAAEYLKTLCYNLKINKKDKKPVTKCATISLKSKSYNFIKHKKVSKKSAKIKVSESKKNNKHIHSLFRKQQKDNFTTNSKNKISKNSPVLILFNRNE